MYVAALLGACTCGVLRLTLGVFLYHFLLSSLKQDLSLFLEFTILSWQTGQWAPWDLCVCDLQSQCWDFLCVLGIPTQVFLISSSHNSQHYWIQLAISPKYSSHRRVLRLATLPGLHFPVILLYHWKCLFRPAISFSFFSYLLAQSPKCGLHCGIFLVP